MNGWRRKKNGADEVTIRLEQTPEHSLVGVMKSSANTDVLHEAGRTITKLQLPIRKLLVKAGLNRRIEKNNDTDRNRE